MDYFTLPLFSLQPATKEIPLTKGYVAIVDAADYEWLMQWKWRIISISSPYASRTQTLSDGISRRHIIFMHRVIMDAPEGMTVDHINGNKLDNTRANLRLATKQQNTCNQPGRSKSVTSKYKGVHWSSWKQKWAAQIRFYGKKIWLGVFVSEVDAALAYNEAAIRYHGDFAYLNDVSTEDNKGGSHE